MKKVLLFVGLFFLLFTAKAQQIPLLDRALFFGNPEISAGQLSPDGKWISFMKEYNGIMNLWVKKTEEPFSSAKPLTDSKRPLAGYFWSEDGKYLLYVKDENGNENMNIFSVNPNTTAEKGKIPASKNLTPLKDVTAGIVNVSRKNPDLMFVTINDRDKAWHDLYSLKISTGELKKIYENKDRVSSYDFDWDDNLKVLNKTDEKGNTTMFLKKGDQLKPIYETNVSESAYIAGYTPDNSKMYMVTNKGDLDKSTLFLFDPETLTSTKIESDPENKVDLGGINFDRNTRKIISTSYVVDKTKYYWKDKNREEMYNFLQNKFPGREISFVSATKDYSKFLISTSGDKYASDVYLFDPKTKNLAFQYTPRPKLKEVEKYLAEMKPISYKSSDGLVIPAYLTLPVGSSGKNLPMIVMPHGGPKGQRDYWGYNSYVQFLANRGYAVLLPNFRASGGYGKKFENAGDLQWGKLMQDDITWGVKYLIDQGIADKDKVVIMGGSYGGYATLAGLTFTPKLYAGGVDIVGPSNIFTLLNSVPAYWESFKSALYMMTGDPNTEEGKKRITEASPLFHVDKIEKPLLVIQGANDPRVNKAEADQIVIALRNKGKKVEYLLADDEGHGFRKPVNSMAMFAAIEKFLAEVIGGRYQKDMPEDVAKRLKEITMDTSKVTYEPKKEILAQQDLPKLNGSLSARTENYDAIMEMGANKIPMQVTRTISKKVNNWLIKDVATSAMGKMTDEMEVDSNYKILSRTIEQMGQKIPLIYGNKNISMEMMGKKMDIPVSGLVVEGPITDFIVTSVPRDKPLTFEVLDMTSMKMKKQTLSFAGEETLNGKKVVKANVVSNDNPNDKTIYWINKENNEVLKSETNSPAMGGMKITVTKK